MEETDHFHCDSVPFINNYALYFIKAYTHQIWKIKRSYFVSFVIKITLNVLLCDLMANPAFILSAGILVNHTNPNKLSPGNRYQYFFFLPRRSQLVSIAHPPTGQPSFPQLAVSLKSVWVFFITCSSDYRCPRRRAGELRIFTCQRKDVIDKFGKNLVKCVTATLNKCMSQWIEPAVPDFSNLDRF